MIKNDTGIIFEKSDKFDKYRFIFKEMFRDLIERKFKVRFHKKQILCLRRFVNKLNPIIFSDIRSIHINSNIKLSMIYNQFDKIFAFYLNYMYLQYKITLTMSFNLNNTNKCKLSIFIHDWNNHNRIYFDDYNGVYSVNDINKVVKDNIKV